MTAVSKIVLDTKVLDRIARDLGKNTDEALAAIGQQVQGEAKVRAPVDTGALENSIETTKKKRGLYWVHDGVEYGIYQELGTSKMAAQPFMVPAVETVIRYIAKMWGGLFE